MKVLIVNEDQGILNALESGLLRYQFRILVSPGIQDAILALEKEEKTDDPVRIILADIETMEQNGFHFIQKARALSADIWFIFMVPDQASRYDSSKPEYHRLDFIEKPFQPETLVHKIRNHLSEEETLVSDQGNPKP